MDRPEHPEQPEQDSIFKRPDAELDDAWKPRRLGQPATDDGIHDLEPSVQDGPIPARYDPLYPRGVSRREEAGLSRPMLIAIGGGGLLALVAAGFIVMSLFGGDGAAAAASPTPASSASASRSAEPDESAAPSATPVPTPPPAPKALAANQWATVVTDGVNVRKEASASAEIVGGARRGEIILIDTSKATEVDGLSFYYAIVSPGVAGYVAAHDASEQFVLSDAPTTTVEWCGVPDRPINKMNRSTGQMQTQNSARIGGLPVSAELLGDGGVGVVDLAWGTADPVCLHLTIRDGVTSDVALDADMEACGHMYTFGGPVMITFGSGAVASDGTEDSRTAVVADTVIGYDSVAANGRPNLADVLMLGESREVCVTASASGAATSPAIDFSARTTTCSWVSERSDSVVELSHPDGYLTVELRLTPGSFVGPGVTEQSSASARQGFRVSATAGIDGTVGISPFDMPGCEG